MKQHKSLMRSTSVFAAMTLLSRVTGFMRDIVIANMFGATGPVEAFIIAFKIPNFMRRLFAEGAFSQAFVPILAEYQQRGDQAAVRDFIAKVMGCLAVALLVVTVIAVICSPLFVMLFAPGFIDEPLRFNLTSYLLKITFPFLLLISLTAMVGAVLNTYGVFGPPALAPSLMNVVLIIGALMFASYFQQPIEALAWAVLVSGVVQLVFLLPFMWQRGLLSWPKVAWRDSAVQRVLSQMLPAVFGASVSQINLLIDTLFASFLMVGSISWLYYSERLMNFPLGIFGVAISTVIMPSLARHFASKDEQHYSKTLDWALRLILLIALPATIGLMMMASPLMSVLFEHGKFTEYDVIMSARSLQAFAFGLPAFMLVKVFSSGFYGRQNIRTPVKVAGITVILNLVFSCIFIWPLGHAGLALATSLAAFCNSGILFYLLHRNSGVKLQPGWGKFLWQMGLANVLVIVFILLSQCGALDTLAFYPSSRTLRLLLVVLVSSVLYIATLWLQGMRPAQFIGKFE